MRFLLFVIALCLMAGGAHAKRSSSGIVSFGSEKLHVIAKLPDTAEYNVDGKQLDIGLLYKDYSFMFIPLWQSDKQYVGMTRGDNKSYYAWPSALVEKVSQSAGLKLPPVNEVDLGFWMTYGGKLAFAGVVLVIALMYRRKAKQATEVVA
ncbi:hypothetical protein [Pseudovibrio brasiliensis]|uniref:Uncharacterized protein n=1 Tax=Pseudovibrio brasiliensis TaxID=1898042 RepID=A0ABX8AHY3_9HYPH|nr:hypothetical protein [Pseudovibrio brasiliensis]QUS54223.1 hypothetical protein KGB56_12480 [Pseudovibrio brasiliensis]